MLNGNQNYRSTVSTIATGWATSRYIFLAAKCHHAVATIATNTVTWNGSIPGGGGTVTITIDATIDLATTGDVSNQGTINFDADGNGTNESNTTTDDPVPAGANDPTTITVVGGGPSIVEIPTLSQLALALLALALLGFGWLHVRRLG